MKLRKALDDNKLSRKQQAYNFFVKNKGYRPEVALGIVGNLMQESHPDLRTDALGFDGTGSFGIAQWLGDRKSKLKEIRPNDYNTLQGQLEFIDWELKNTEKRAFNKIKSASTPEEATLAFSKYYERPHKDYAHNDKRIRYALSLGEELGVTFEKEKNNTLTSKEYKQDFQPQKIDNTFVKNPPLINEKINKSNITNLSEQRLKEIFGAPVGKQENFVEQTPQEKQIQDNYIPQLDIYSGYQIEDINQFQNGGEMDREEFIKKLPNITKYVGNSNMSNLDSRSGLAKDFYRNEEKEKYLNPDKVIGISSSDTPNLVDFLYYNDYLIDTPIIGDYIKKQAKQTAVNSRGSNIIDPKDVMKTDTEEYKGYQDNNNPVKSKISLIDQYFSEKPLLKKSKYTPKSDYLDFLPVYSIKNSIEDEGMKKHIEKKLNNAIFSFFDKGELDIFLSSKKPIYKSTEEFSEISKVLNVDLGGHKIGAAWDEEVGLPYVSISDAWDFSPEHYSEKWKVNTLNDSEEDIEKNKKTAYIQAYLMHKAGNPFKVYDRFYFDPNTKKYVEDSEINSKLQNGGYINNTGYLRNSETKHNPYNIIPSGNITMEGVDIELDAIPFKNGNPQQKRTLTPGNNYKFDADYVLEIPKYQNGGKSMTRQDSLNLYNNSLKIKDFYDKNKYSLLDENIKPKEIFKQLDEKYNTFDEGKMRFLTENGVPNDRTITKEEYRKSIDDNIFLQRELDSKILNMDAPMQLYDRRVYPNIIKTYQDLDESSSSYRDKVNIPTYDPISVKPYDMLTPEEIKERKSKYGPKKPIRKPRMEYLNIDGNPIDFTVENEIDTSKINPLFEESYWNVDRIHRNRRTNENIYSKEKLERLKRWYKATEDKGNRLNVTPYYKRINKDGL